MWNGAWYDGEHLIYLVCIAIPPQLSLREMQTDAWLGFVDEVMWSVWCDARLVGALREWTGKAGWLAGGRAIDCKWFGFDITLYCCCMPCMKNRLASVAVRSSHASLVPRNFSVTASLDASLLSNWMAWWSLVVSSMINSGMRVWNLHRFADRERDGWATHQAGLFVWEFVFSWIPWSVPTFVMSWGWMDCLCPKCDHSQEGM